MTRLRDWVVAGAVLPAVFIAVPGVAVLLSGGVPDATATLGVILLAVLMLSPAGAVIGTAVGAVVLACARRLPPHGSPRRAAVVRRAAAAVSVLCVGASAVVIGLTASDDLSLPAYLGYSVVYAAVPATLAVVALSRWRPAARIPPDAIGAADVRSTG